MGASDFTTKDSGARATFESGMQRDTQEGKPRFELMLPLDIPYDEQMIVRLAALYGRGAEKYEDRNWEKANSEEEMARMKASAFRHFMQWITGETDEDHAAGAMFNIIAFETTAYKVSEGVNRDFDALADEILGEKGRPDIEVQDLTRTFGPESPSPLRGEAQLQEMARRQCGCADCVPTFPPVTSDY